MSNIDIQPHQWFPPNIKEWERSGVTLPDGVYCTIMRRWGITITYRFELDDDSGKPYEVTRMKGGQVLGRRRFTRVPQHIDQILHHPRRRKSYPHVNGRDHQGVSRQARRAA